MIKPTTIDFETQPITPRPQYPPQAVGVAIKYWGKRARYYAWGHSTENNCSKSTAYGALQDAYKTPDGVLFHNAKFDVDVAEIDFGLPRLPWDKYHDTLFLLFLNDPHALELGLKSAAEQLLGLKPTEQDAISAWLVQHQPVKGVCISVANKSEHYFGRYIAYAPGNLVGKYAIGDVERTEALFKLLYPSIVGRNMLIAYDRERKLMPILLDNERRGVLVDVYKLQSDTKLYTSTRNRLDSWVLKTLKAPELNIDSGLQLVGALLRADKVDENLLGITPTGKPRSDKDSLAAAITDTTLSAVLRYRTQVNTCLNTFMTPWLSTASEKKSKGHIFTNWNQIRSTESGASTGTRTGRLSSTPNFQNIPNMFKEPALSKPFKLPPLPMVRGYIIPPKGCVLINRDYSQQELRILAHFEDGALRDAYLKDPWLDVHEYARNLINKLLNKQFERKPIKNTGFGLIYGMGLGMLAEKSGSTVEEAKEVKNAYLAIFPGLKAMNQDMNYRAKANKPIRTWGGREYYCEPPKLVDGRVKEFAYKMLNVLIQGSAADCTKEALICYEELKPKEHTTLLTVHDEILCVVPRKDLTRGMNVLKTAMESVVFDVPMLSEGAWSTAGWVDLKDYDKGGVNNAD